MFKSLKFGKPKNPGFGISRNFYLTVLAARAPLPSIYSLVNPKSEGGAVEGFGVPLCSNACQSILHEPLARGAYAVASKDRKTVLRCLVLSKEEAGFDPEVYAASSAAKNAHPEVVARVRGTWSLIQLTFESHDAMVAPALDFLLSFALRAASLTDGVLADPMAAMYRLPEQVKFAPGNERISALVHVAVHTRVEGNVARVYTLGLQKFGIAEFEVLNVPEHLVPAARALVGFASQHVLDGNLTGLGDSIAGFKVHEGGLDRALWDGIACNELSPPPEGLEACLTKWR